MLQWSGGIWRRIFHDNHIYIVCTFCKSPWCLRPQRKNAGNSRNFNCDEYARLTDTDISEVALSRVAKSAGNSRHAVNWGLWQHWCSSIYFPLPNGNLEHRLWFCTLHWLLFWQSNTLVSIFDFETQWPLGFWLVWPCDRAPLRCTQKLESAAECNYQGTLKCLSQVCIHFGHQAPPHASNTSSCLGIQNGIIYSPRACLHRRMKED